MTAAAHHKGSGGTVLSSALCDSMGLCQGRVRLGVRKRVMRPWNRLPRAVGMAPSCPSSRNIWKMLSDVGFGFWVVLCGARTWT